MKYSLKRPRNILLFILAALCLLAAYLFNKFHDTSRELNSVSARITSTVHSVFDKIPQQAPDSLLRRLTVRSRLSVEQMEEIQLWPYAVLIYRRDSLVFWSKNEFIPPQGYAAMPDQVSFLSYRQNIYAVQRRVIPPKNTKPEKEMLHAVFLFPVFHSYTISNDYLKPHFNSLFALHEHYSFSSENRTGAEPVLLSNSSSPFYLHRLDNSVSLRDTVIVLLLFLLGGALLTYLLLELLQWAGEKQNHWLLLVLLGVLFLGWSYFLAQKHWLPPNIQQAEIFNPDYFASPFIAESLGSLVILLCLLLWFCLFVVLKLNLKPTLPSALAGKYAVAIGGYLAIGFCIWYGSNLVKSLVRDSNIYFEFINPFTPDWHSTLGVFSIALAMACFILITIRISEMLRAIEMELRDRLLSMVIALAVFFLYLIYSDSGIQGVWILAWSVLYFILLPNFRFPSFSGVSFLRLFAILVFFCASGSLLLNQFEKQKEKGTRLTYARKLITQRDVVTEFLLANLTDSLNQDKFIPSYFSRGVFSRGELSERLRQLYFQNGFNRYTLVFYYFDPFGVPLHYSASDSLQSERKLKVGKTPVLMNQLYYQYSPSGDMSYLAEYAVREQGMLMGKIYVELSANNYPLPGVFPELLLEERDKLPKNTRQYSFAIYNAGQLIRYKGDYSYDFRFSIPVEEDRDVQYVKLNQFDHLVYAPDEEVQIVVSAKSEPIRSFISYFSYLFVFLFLILMFVLLANGLWHQKFLVKPLEALERASFRSLIHGFFMVFIFALIVLIGYITSRFFILQFSDISRERVHEKLKEVSGATAFILQSKLNEKYTVREAMPVLREQVNELSTIYEVDISFFDPRGNLVATSHPAIFDKGIISSRINQLALIQLTNNRQTSLLLNEQIGNLQYFSGYTAIRNKGGRVMAVVNLPYFDTRQELNEQVGFFFVTLVNILVFATILAGLMAPIVSRQITRKLFLIEEQFKQVKLGGKNQLIKWNAKDEIGSLVEEYNLMMLKLEESAAKLAQSERESAWREMARQVAHEIKNPLTPMKLSIQHLQRAYENNSPNLKELTARVTETLVEQIENLSGIATEFSNFAVMPEPVISRMSVHEVLKKVVDLFARNESMQFTAEWNAGQDMVMADKDQLMRVFNNILLNAVQSIPDHITGMIEVSTYNSKESVVIQISDNGAGISAEAARKVFTPNFTTKTSGTGLGLAICKNIVESFKGEIWFSANEDSGTSFFIRLPLSFENEG